tara:strand:+ start:12396 stop:14762 length:2367 start_codon:yes stop_codon:yes gene_type:complete
MRIIKIIYLLSIINGQVRIGDWRAHTSPLDVKQIIYPENKIIAATGGGLLVVNDQNYYTLTTVEGLEGVNLKAISYVSDNLILIGGSYPHGFIQMYDLANRRSVEVFDFGLSEVLDFQIQDSLLFALFQDGKDFGLMKFILNKKWNYSDSYKNFSPQIGPINCFTIKNSQIFLGTDSGIWVGDLNTNLKDPNNWIKAFNDIIDQVTAFAKTKDFILCSTNESLLKIYPNQMISQPIQNSLTTFAFNNICYTDNILWISKGNNLYRLNEKNESLVFNFDFLINSLYLDQINGLVVSTSNGLSLLSKSDIDNFNYKFKNFIPNAPVTNSFTSITVLEDGRLVGGSSKGISILDENGWRNIIEINKLNSEIINTSYDYSHFIADTVPFDFGGFVADLEQGPDGLVYAAIRGSYVYQDNPAPRYSGGVLIVDIDNPSNISVIDTAYLSYHSTTTNPVPYLVVLDIEFDKNGNLWIADPYSINGNNPLHVRSGNGVWKHYGSAETEVKISQSPNSIAFDKWGRVWLSAFQAEEANLGIYPNGGLFMLYYLGDPFEPESFVWTKIIPDGTIRSVAMGNEDRLFFLTPSGLNYYDLNNGPNIVASENPYPYFPNISFGSGAELKVDPHGNIWTHSPTHGVHVLLENTTYWPDINGFRRSNSPLLSDEINDIDFDEKKSLAYIATKNGLNVIRVPFGISKKNYSEAKVYPSPFYIPSEKPLKIDGIPFQSSMLILTLDGNLVATIQNRGESIDGDQLSWDGRNKKGKYVSSGVYLLAIYEPNGKSNIEKITVIRTK